MTENDHYVLLRRIFGDRSGHLHWHPVAPDEIRPPLRDTPPWNTHATHIWSAMSHISVIVGNPKPASRTRQIAEELAARIAAETGAHVHPTVDLIDHAAELFTWPAPQLDAIAEQLRTSTFAVIATPTYKASYTGLLKAFLDRYPARGLAGVAAVPVFTTASDEHALAVEFTLRPLLVELGASVPTRGLAFPTPRFDRRATVLDEWFATEGQLLARAGVPVVGASAGSGAASAPLETEVAA